MVRRWARAWCCWWAGRMRPHTSPPSGTSSPGFSQVTQWLGTAPLDKCSLNAVDPDISLLWSRMLYILRKENVFRLCWGLQLLNVSVQIIDLIAKCVTKAQTSSSTRLFPENVLALNQISFFVRNFSVVCTCVSYRYCIKARVRVFSLKVQTSHIRKNNSLR